MFVDELRPFDISFASFDEGDIKRLTDIGDINSIFDPGAGALSGLIVEFDCDVGVQALDAVYIDANTGVLQKALADDISTARVAGLVLEKVSATRCRFVQTGPLSGYTNLVPEDVYYLSSISPGVITNVIPTAPDIFVPVGQALTNTILLVDTTKTRVKRK